MKKANLIPYRFVNGNLEFYLSHRSKDAQQYPDLWSFWGGKIETDETTEQAMLREINEELTWTPEIYEFLGVFYDSMLNEKNVYYTEVGGDFEKNINIKESQGGKFFTKEEIEMADTKKLNDNNQDEGEKIYITQEDKNILFYLYENKIFGKQDELIRDENKHWEITQVSGGATTINESYFMYGGIFLHFWSIVEFLVNKIVVEKELSFTNTKNKKEKFSDIKDRRLYYKNIKNKLSAIAELQNTDWGEPLNFRNTMAHHIINATINIGSSQQQIGWIKPYKNQEESRKYNETMKRLKLIEPEMSYFDTYSEKEIKILIEKTITLIGKLQKLTKIDHGRQFSIENNQILQTLKGNRVL